MSGVVPVIPRFKFFKNGNNPVSSGSVTVYLAGTLTLANTYQDQALTISNTNPVDLDAEGECTFWVDPANNYKFLVTTGLAGTGATVAGWPVDNIPGASAGTAASLSFLQAGTGAVTRTTQDKGREIVSAADWGTIGGTSVDSLSVIQTAITNYSTTAALYIPPVPGLYKVTNSLSFDKNDIHLYGDPRRITQMTALYCSTDNPVIKVDTTGSVIRSRYTLQNVMLLGDKSGNRSGSNKNTASLFYAPSPAELNSVIFEKCDLRRGATAAEIATCAYLKFSDCTIYNNDVGVKFDSGLNVVLHKCDLEVNATAALQIGTTQGQVASLTIDGCYFETNGRSTIYAYSTTLRDCSLAATSFTFGKGSSRITISNLTCVNGSEVGFPPGLNNDITIGGASITNLVNFGSRAKLRNLPVYGVTPVAADGLDYLQAVNVQKTASGSQALTVSFLRDASTVSTDTMTVYRASTTQAGSEQPEYMTYGVVDNTGTAISVSAAAAGTRQISVKLPSLLKNGTFPAGDVTNWGNTTTTVTHDGTYLRLAGTTGLFFYNRIIHVPSTDTLYVMARVKPGSVGYMGIQTESVSGQPQKITSYFDNNDGTFDDLWVCPVVVRPFSTLAKVNVQFRKLSAGSAYDIQVRWVAVVPAWEGDLTFKGSFTWDPASLAAAATATTTIMTDSSTSNDLKQATVGDQVRITARIVNPTAAPIDLGSGSWGWELTKRAA
jgi:hypothetical protein